MPDEKHHNCEETQKSLPQNLTSENMVGDGVLFYLAMGLLWAFPSLDLVEINVDSKSTFFGPSSTVFSLCFYQYLPWPTLMISLWVTKRPAHTWLRHNNGITDDNTTVNNLTTEWYEVLPGSIFWQLKLVLFFLSTDHLGLDHTCSCFLYLISIFIVHSWPM